MFPEGIWKDIQKRPLAYEQFWQAVKERKTQRKLTDYEDGDKIGSPKD